MSSPRALVNKRAVGACATVLRRTGPLPLHALMEELYDKHRIGLTAKELSKMVSMYGPERGVMVHRKQHSDSIYYVEDNREGLEWWTR